MKTLQSLAAFVIELPGAILSLCPSKDFPDEPGLRSPGVGVQMRGDA